MTLTPAQALAYVEERQAELAYDLARAEERIAAIKTEQAEAADQARLLRKLTETECPPLETID